MNAKPFSLTDQDILDLYVMSVHYRALRKLQGCPALGLNQEELNAAKSMAKAYIIKVKESFPLTENELHDK